MSGEYDHTVAHTLEVAVVTTERVTVSLPSELLEGMDRFERNRSRFIAEAVEHELERRRREGMLRSLQTPHPNSHELLELGTSDWLAGLPDDDATLLASDSGTPVTWVPGEGWKSGAR
jgi:hypothetical protein